MKKYFPHNWFKPNNQRDEDNCIFIDLGTANTVMGFSNENNIAYNQPSVIAIDINSNTIIATGHDAKQMDGKANKNIMVIETMKNGVITNINIAKGHLKFVVIKKLQIDKRKTKNLTVLLACPSTTTDLERESLKQLGWDLGAKRVLIEEEVKMAAIGGGCNIQSSKGHLIIDIGGGTTDIAIIASGDIVVSKSVKVAGTTFNEEIQKYVKTQYGMDIGRTTAESIKKEIGSLTEGENEEIRSFYGSDSVTNMPRKIELHPAEIRPILQEAVKPICDLTRELLSVAPPELAGDIYHSGITLCGGGALIKGIIPYLQANLNLPVKCADYPLLAVLNGTRKYWNEILKNQL